MSDNLIKEASFESKKEFKLPQGATMISSSHRVTVEEIENGFILRKSYDIKYSKKGSDENGYEYFTKSWYSKENPLQITMPKETSLADKF